MKRILVLSDSFSGYGAEYMIGWVGSMLADSGHEVIFCSPFDDSKDSRLSSRAKFIGLGLKRKANPILKAFNYFLFTGLRICKICRDEHVDMIITFKENPLCLSLVAKMCSAVKCVHSERDDPYNRDTVASKTKMWFYRFADHLVFQTNGAQDYFCQKIKEKSTIIPNPVTIPAEEWSLSQSSKTIINVGRLNIRYKRQDLLLKAFSKFVKSYPNWRLVFLGDGKDLEKLSLLSRELGIEKYVDFKGKVSNVKENLLNAGVFVLSSDTEGMPNVLMEAMSIGIPVVATDCSPGGGRFLVNNLSNGLLVPKGDVNKLHDALVKLASQNISVVNMGIQARKDMEKFAPNIISKKWIQTINKI